MKLNNLAGLMAFSLFCVASFTLSAQKAPATTVTSKAAKLAKTPASFELSAISLSDPAIYADAPFSISVMVKNTGAATRTKEVQLLLKDGSAAKGKRKHAGKKLVLRPGQSEAVTFTFKAKDLLEPGSIMPEIFVFYLGEYEVGVAYEGK